MERAKREKAKREKAKREKAKWEKAKQEKAKREKAKRDFAEPCGPDTSAPVPLMIRRLRPGYPPVSIAHPL